MPITRIWLEADDNMCAECGARLDRHAEMETSICDDIDKLLADEDDYALPVSF
jgi:hypothetical protein